MPKQTYQERELILETFLAELGRGIPSDERVMIGNADEATTERDSSGKTINGGWWPEPWYPGKGVDLNCNFFACISSSIKTPRPKDGKMRFWRGEASFGHGLALMVDDVAISEESRGIGSKGALTVADLSSILPPTTVIETSPGNAQCMYFMDEPVSNMKRFKAFLTCFVDAVLKDKGGDYTIRDVSRYGRAPAGFNNKRHSDGSLKYPDERGRPWMVQLREHDYSRRYSMEEIARAFNFYIAEPPERKAPVLGKDERAIEKVWLVLAVALLGQSKAGEGTRGEVVMNMSGKYRIRCPWGDEHTNGDPYGAYFRGPIPGYDVDYVFGCAHDTCRKDRKRKWGEFIDEIVMPPICDDLLEATAALQDVSFEELSTWREV